MNTLSVNQALHEKSSVSDLYCCIDGILNFDFENQSLQHYPKSERSSDNRYSYSLWIDEKGIYKFNDQTLKKWSGQRVVICGELEVIDTNEALIDGFDNGFGHFSLWNARILVERIELKKRWLKNHTENQPIL